MALVVLPKETLWHMQRFVFAAFVGGGGIKNPWLGKQKWRQTALVQKNDLKLEREVSVVR